MRLARVMVAVDFSGPSLAAARWVARELAPGAEIVLAHVIRAPEAPSFVRPFLPATIDLLADIAPALAGGLRGVGESLAVPHVRIEMLAGDPAEALASAATAAEVDLVCVGRPRSRRGSARFGATTAHRLIARSAVPVLVVPAEQRGAPSRIVAAIDDGRAARAVVEASLAVAAAHEAVVEGIHVLSPELESMARSARLEAPAGARARFAASGTRHALRDEEELLQLTRDWIDRQLRTGARVQSGAHARVGDVGQEIIAGAQALEAGLVVMGRGGDVPRRARDDVLPVGSTTRMVSWAATCPVLVIPGERVLASTPRGRKIGFARGMTPAGGPPDAA